MTFKGSRSEKCCKKNNKVTFPKQFLVSRARKNCATELKSRYEIWVLVKKHSKNTQRARHVEWNKKNCWCVKYFGQTQPPLENIQNGVSETVSVN